MPTTWPSRVKLHSVFNVTRKFALERIKNIQIETPVKQNNFAKIRLISNGSQRFFLPVNENEMFMLLKRLGLYVAAVHVPSNARVLFGVMAQVVHPGPSHGEAGR